MKLFPGAAGLALFLATHGYRKGSLSLDGALTALIAGYATLANDLKLFGVLMIVFYLVGSRASKYKADLKNSYDASHTLSKPSLSNSQLAGNRNAVQVLANSIVAIVCSILYRSSYGDLGGTLTQNLPECALSNSHAKFLITATIFFFSACTGDTLASELGILSKDPPRLITTGQVVHRGTNGGVSLWGLVVSTLGGLLIGVTACLLLSVQTSCPLPTYSSLTAKASLAGLFGSLLDSFLGATLQQTLYSQDKKRVVSAKTTDPSVIVTNGLAILNNDAVNVIASSITALGFAYLF